jgi:hypothetical protein
MHAKHVLRPGVVMGCIAGLAAVMLAGSCAQLLGIEELSPSNGTDGGIGPGRDGGITPVGDGGIAPGGDGGVGPGGDGGVSPACGPTECTNCIDDDGDGLTDGDDVHCIAYIDNDESSFYTGIPGDNIDPSRPDCFYDGNSGSGDDGCVIDICCLLGNCPTGTDCSVTQQCIDFCSGAAVVGCDCFGCCTLCANGICSDVLVIPDATPGWSCNDLANLGDPLLCPSCNKQTSCSTSCNDPAVPSADCILCPGQSRDELPPECSGQNQCPNGRQACSAMAPCPGSQYCSHGCCIDTIIQ